VIQLSPPLVADTEEFEEIDRILRSVLTEAWERIVRHETLPSTGARRNP
jgi:hypothetical protein